MRRTQVDPLQSPELLRVDALMSEERFEEVVLRPCGNGEGVWLEVWFV
jgi:hypothetical protein